MDPSVQALLVPLLTHPVCVEPARHALGEPVQLVEVTALLRRPGAPAHPLHCTGPAAWFAEHGFKMPAYRIVLPFSWILTDLTHESGSRLFMPFSHLSGRLPDFGSRHAVSPISRAGRSLAGNKLELLSPAS
ncbi:MAG: phytanoyl-CoA dioxygenase family protein [bacterium]|nr:phytanoyl-CoA dioxygenase family protein [bacterium]